MKTNVHIDGTHCSACKILIEEVSCEQEGVASAEVDYQTGATVIEHDERLDWQKLKAEIESLGDYILHIS